MKMTHLIRAELRKFFTTRLWWGMGIAVIASAAAFAVLLAFVFTTEFGDTGASADLVMTDVQIANSVYTAGLSVGYLLMLTIGILQIGSEYRHRTLTSTFLASPRRAKAMSAKISALGIIAAGYGVVSVVTSTATGALILSARDVNPFPSIEIGRTLLLSLLVLFVWALIGLGAGILIPNQVAAILVSVGVAWIVEPILSAVLQIWEFPRTHIVPYLPSGATNAVIDGVMQTDEVRLAWWAGALTLIAYAAVFSGLGILRIRRSDIS